MVLRPCCDAYGTDDDGVCQSARIWGTYQHVLMATVVGIGYVMVRDIVDGDSELGPRTRVLTCSEAVARGVPPATVRIAHSMPVALVDTSMPPLTVAERIARLGLRIDLETWNRGTAEARGPARFICAHTVTTEPCAHCAAVVAEFERRNYAVRITSQPLHDTSDRVTRLQSWKTIAIDTPRYAEDAVRTVALGLPLTVWRRYYLSLSTAAESPTLAGIWCPWKESRFVAGCYSYPGLRARSGKDTEDWARELAIEHLKSGICQCGIYGLYDWRGVYNRDQWESYMTRAEPVWLGECTPDGTVIFGTRGVRASEMYMNRLFCINGDRLDLGLLDRIAARYGVPLWVGSLAEFLALQHVPSDDPLWEVVHGTKIAS
jgi:hypothetical protein